jgi:hypothetical protein
MPAIPTIAYASGTLTIAGVPSDGDTVTIGGVVYTFVNTLVTAHDVLIGATAAATLVNLKAALNADSVSAGVLYGAGTDAHQHIVATTLTATTLKVVSRVVGVIGNLVSVAESSTVLSWSGSVLSGGVGSVMDCFTAIRDYAQINASLISAIDHMIAGDPVVEEPVVLVPTSVLVTPEAPNLAHPDTVQLTAVVLDQNGNAIAGLSPSNWLSSSPSVATVNSSGLVTTVSGNGSATISVSYLGLIGMATVTTETPEAPVHHVNISPASASMQEGSGPSIHTADPEDVSNNNLIGRVVTAISDDENVATVGVSGYTVTITVVGEGSCDVTVSCEGQDVVIPVVITPASPDATLPNLPSDFVIIAENNCDGAIPSSTSTVTTPGTGGKGQFRRANTGANLTLLAGGYAGGADCWDIKYPSGFGDGSSPSGTHWIMWGKKSNPSNPTNSLTSPEQVDEVYIAHRFIAGPLLGTFDTHPSNEKQHLVGSGEVMSQAQNQNVFGFAGNSAAPMQTTLKLSFRNQDYGTTSQKTQNINSSPLITCGDDVLVEWWAKINSPADVFNGEVKGWVSVNGGAPVLVMHHTGLQLRNLAEPRRFQQYQRYPCFGGNNDVTKAQEDHIYDRRIVVAVK